MTKSHTARLKAEIPVDQRCEFVLGPVGSWLLPSSADIWSGPQDTSSWFIYASKGCFCFGRVTHEKWPTTRNQGSGDQKQRDGFRPVALTDHIEYIKNDSSRVVCCRFCKDKTNRPMAFILTENGTLILYDCSTRTIKMRISKGDIMQKMSQASHSDEMEEGENRDYDEVEEPSAKKLKFAQHITSVSWPDRNNAFLSVSMSQEKSSYVLWLKIPDTIFHQDHNLDQNSGDLIEFVRLGTSASYTNVVCMEATFLQDNDDNNNNIIIAIGFDDGLINIIKVNTSKGPYKKIVVLKRHSDQICSLSLWSSASKEYASGLLASVSRDGLVLVWDIENQYYFADYSINAANAKDNRRQNESSAKNWFGSSFIKLEGQKDNNVPYLVVSNSSGGLVNLEIPKKVHASKIRLNDNSKHGTHGQGIRHRMIIFNASFDKNCNILMTTSLDGNLIFWNCYQNSDNNNNGGKGASTKLAPSYMMPTMANNARSHMMRFSPIANDHLALALGKAGLRFYRIPSERKDFNFQMSHGCFSAFYHVNKQKLAPTSVAWHPNHEYRLAVGTLEGVIIRLDIKDSGNGSIIQSLPVRDEPTSQCDDPFDVEYVPHTNADTQFGNRRLKTNAIYSLCWGPNPLAARDTDKQAIYSVGSYSNSLSIHVSKDEDKDKSKGDNLVDIVQKMPSRFSNIDEFFKLSSEVAWKPSLDYMALGTTDGRVLIVHLNGDEANHLFVKLIEIQDIFKSHAIQSLAWHLTSYKDDDYYYYLAVVSRDSHDLHIFDFRDTVIAEELRLEQLTLEEGASLHVNQPGYIRNSEICLSGHKHSVTDICWSPHEENQLCSSSFDATNIVWQLEGSNREGGITSRILSRYVARDRLFTSEWSLVDNDLILTSGQDSTVIAWRPSENMMDSMEE